MILPRLRCLRAALAMALLLGAMSVLGQTRNGIMTDTLKPASDHPGSAGVSAGAEPKANGEALNQNGDLTPRDLQPTSGTVPDNQSLLTTEEIGNGAIVLGFGLLCILICYRTFRSTQDKTLFVRLVSSILIVVAVLFLVTTGISERVVAGAYALLGTVAGYVLGRTSGSGNSQPPQSPPPPP